MTPTKLLIGQILVVFAIVIAGVWAATQWCAAMLGYQPQLGEAWFVLSGTPVYRPWAIFRWWYHYEAYAPEVFDKAGALAGASGFLGCAAAIAGSLWRARQSRYVTTYGSARWATKREAERAGLHGDTGVFLGKLGGRYLRHDGPEHVMALPRSTGARCPVATAEPKMSSELLKLPDDDHLLDSVALAAIRHIPVSRVNKERLTGDGPPFIKDGHLVRYRLGDYRLWLAAKQRFKSTSEVEAA